MCDINVKIMTKIADFLNKNDRFAADAGCRIVEMEEGRAVAEMTVTPHHLKLLYERVGIEKSYGI